MNKELKYGGYSASPNDHDNLEGDLAVAMNLIPENGTIRPVLPPGEVFTLPDGYTVMCIHHTSAYKHYILKDSGGGLWWIDDADEYHTLHGNGSIPEGPMYDFGEADIYKVEPIGNTLTVLTSTGIHYILWKIDGYKYLGSRLPDLDIQFFLTTTEYIFSGFFFVELSSDGSTPTESSITGNEELYRLLRENIMASANKAVGDALRKKLFVFPFFVRYALRLYDGNITMHSAPMLMVPVNNGLPDVSKGFTVDSNGFINEREAATMSSVAGNSLRFMVLDPTQLEAFSSWSDIVTSVDIYVSPQFYPYNQAAGYDKINLFNKPHLEVKDIGKEVCDNGNFYFIKSITINKLEALTSGAIDIDFEPSNENIVVRERMSDDYNSHDELIAEKSYSFNGRVNLAGVKRKLFNGFNPCCLWWFAGLNKLSTTHTVVIEEEGKNIVVQSPTADIWYNDNYDTVWYFYPNTNAKRAYAQIGSRIVELTLLPHPTLNGAYYSSLDTNAVSKVVTSIPALSGDDERIVNARNILYTSEVNNPFFFPVSGINSVGAGEILGICSAVKALSQGQFGQFPLYAFTSEGVWALQTTSTGGYSAVQPVTRDVCTDADSITQLDDAVLFTTARGIMLISGSTSQCISEAIDDDGSPARGLKAITDKLAPLLGLSVDVLPFRDFLEDCRMIYDYRGQRVIVYNPACDYAYIYSLESNKWGMMASDILYSVKTYPDAMAVTRDGHLVNYSDPVEVLQGSALYGTQLLVTRPLTLDQPDVLKTVRTILQRGLFRKRQGHVQSVLYGSRDLMQPWHLVMSSGDENLRGFSGTPYKWFRVALLLRLAPDESVTSCSIQFEPRYNNRLR